MSSTLIPSDREKETRMRRFNVPLNGNQRRVELIKEIAKQTYNAWSTWSSDGGMSHGVQLAYLFATIAGAMDSFAMKINGECAFAEDFKKLFLPGHDVWLFVTEEVA